MNKEINEAFEKQLDTANKILDVNTATMGRLLEMQSKVVKDMVNLSVEYSKKNFGKLPEQGMVEEGVNLGKKMQEMATKLTEETLTLSVMRANRSAG